MPLFDNSVDRRDRIEPSFGVGAAISNADAPLTFEQAARLASWITPTYAGRDVTPESAMRVSTIYACVNLISGIASALPMAIYSGTPKNKIDAPNHPAVYFLNAEPCPGMTAAVYWEYVITSELLTGDAMSWIERDRNGNMLNLWPLNVRATSVIRNMATGRLVYTTSNWKGEQVSYDQDDVLHVPGPGFDGLRGKSVIGWAARQGAGIAMAAEEYAARFFANGARPDFALKFPSKMGKDAKDALTDYYIKRHQGLEASHLPLILTEGGDLKELTLSPEDTQLLATRQFQVVDICRAFGVPPIMVGDSEKTSSWGTGVEQVVLGFVKTRIVPLLRKHAAEINLKILTSKMLRRADYFSDWDFDDLLRGDSKSQAEWIRGLLGGPSTGPGIITPNEGRQRFGFEKSTDANADKLYTPPVGGAVPPPAA